MQVANSVWVNTSSLKRQQSYTKSDRQKGVMFKYVFFLIILAFFCSLFYIWSRIQVVNIGYEINRGFAFKEKLIEENKKLTLEAAILKSPVRLESMAKNELKMDLPQKSQILNRYEEKPLAVAAKHVEVPSKANSKAVPAKKIVVKVDKKSTTAMKTQKDNKKEIKSAKKVENKKNVNFASAAVVSEHR